MPGRATPLVTNEIYHVFNRGIDHRPTFLNSKEFTRALKSVNFYRFVSPPLRLSKFLSSAKQERENLLNKLVLTNKVLVNIISYCLMPNHFHFLLQQAIDGGISKFMSNFQNSYTRYFNVRHNRSGPLFLDQFKAVRIETDEQFLHVSRYIHLNPYTSFVIKRLDQLGSYPWSSLSEFLEGKESFCLKEPVLSFFKTKNDYKKFIFDQADYQRSLEAIKHLILEDK